LNENCAKDGDICVIVGDGVIEHKEDVNTKRKYKLLNLPVEVNGLDLTYTPDKDAIAVMRSAWGADTKAWTGKKFSVKFYPKTVFGQKKTSILPVILEVKA